MTREKSICPGCGLILPKSASMAPTGYHASGECYQKFQELSVASVSMNDLFFVHQHEIDTYCAQHSGAGMKNITIAYSLIGLFFAVERGYTGRQVQHIHMLLAKKKSDWQKLAPPSKPYSLTIQDVLNEEPGKTREEILKKWMSEVWECWEHQHNWVRETVHKLLN